MIDHDFLEAVEAALDQAVAECRLHDQIAEYLTPAGAFNSWRSLADDAADRRAAWPLLTCPVRLRWVVLELAGADQATALAFEKAVALVPESAAAYADWLEERGRADLGHDLRADLILARHGT